MLSKFKGKFKSSKFLISFSTLASGSAIAQIISILMSPITTRIFTPEHFGIYTVIATAVSLFGPVICLKYDMAIVVAKNEKESYSIIKLCILLCLSLSIIVGIVYGLVFLVGDHHGLSLWINIGSTVVLLITYGLNNILLAHNNKNSLYKLISSVTVIKSAVNNILLVIGGLLNAGSQALIFSNIISSFSGLGRQSKDLRKNYKNIKSVNLSEMKEVFLKYSKQPLFNASSAILATSTYSSINLFIKVAYSTEHLGLYSLSYRILGIPFSVISANIARVFFNSAIKEKQDTGTYQETFKKTVLLLTCTIIPMIFLIAILAPWGFSIVFGAEWREAGLYVRILAPMFAIRLITESLTTSFIVSKKQHLELLFQIILFVGELIIYFISFFNNIQIEYFLFLISLLYMLVHCIMLIVMYKSSQESEINVED